MGTKKKIEAALAKATHVAASAGEIVAGALKEGPSKVVARASRMVRDASAVGVLASLDKELRELQEAGRIKSDYLGSPQSIGCLAELLAELEQGSIDPGRLGSLRRVFLVAATESKTDRNSPLPLVFMRICRQLTGEELLLLRVAYDSAQQRPRNWEEFAAEKSGLKHTTLVKRFESDLQIKGLMRGRGQPWSESGGRLTALGHDLCGFLEESGE